MIQHVFALRDKQADIYWAPFMYPSVGQAVRAIKDLLTDNQTLPARHPGDFALYQLASFNDHSGAYEVMSPPVFVSECSALLPKVRPDGEVI